MSLKGTGNIGKEVRAVSDMTSRLESEGIKVWEEEILDGMGFAIRKPTFQAFSRACVICYEDRFKATRSNEVMLKEAKSAKRWSAIAIVFILATIVLSAFLIIGPNTEAPKEDAASTVAATAPPAKKEYEYIEQPLLPVLIYNGDLVKEPASEGLAPLTVSTSGDASYYVYLKPTKPPFGNSMGFYVQGGKSAEVSVPLGEYEIYYAVGNTWYGKEEKFGSDTRYYQCDGTFSFSDDGESYLGWTLELYLQRNGNMETVIVDAADFPG